MKLRNLFYLLLALPLVFAACTEDETDPKPVVKDPVLTITSNAIMQFAAEGGVGEITYTLENAKENVQLTAECVAEWVTDITVGEKVTFVVAANDAEEARDAKITVKYDTESFEVAVMQAAKSAPESVTFEAVALGGFYAGGAEAGLSVDNYCFSLANKAFDEDGELPYGSECYFVDLYVEAYQGEWCETMTIPVGEYSLDLENGETAGTFSHDFSRHMVITEDGEYIPASYEAGKLIVTETGMTLTVTIQGVEHTVTYEGAMTLKNGSEKPFDGTVVELSHTMLYYYGDFYTPGEADNFIIILGDKGLTEDGWEYEDGNYYKFDTYTECIDKTNGISVPYGTYTLAAEYPTEVGVVASAAHYTGDWEVDEAITEGTLTISADGFVAEVVIGGEPYKLVCEGLNPVIVDYTENLGGDEEIISTLTGDVNLNIEGATFVVEDYGDYYYNGTNNYVVYVYEDAENYTGAYLMFDLLAAGANIAGEYACSNDESAYTFFKGYFDSYWEEYYGSWYWDFNTGNSAPFVDGTITIEVDANGKRTLTLNCVDDAGNAITGTIREAGDEGGNEGGGETNANHYEIAEFVWSWIDSDSGCGDIIFKTALDANGDYKAFKLSFNGIPSTNVLPDGEYSSADGSMNASWCYHLLWDNANGCAMESVSATVATDASGVTTINASWIPNNGSNETYTLTWVGEMPIYGADW